MKNLTTKNTVVLVKKTELTSGDDVKYNLEYDLLGQKNVDAAYDEDGIHFIVDEYFESDPMKISDLRNILDNLENAGCNYVSIDYNCDHREYIFTGVDAHVASEEEIDQEKQKLKNKRLKELNDHLKAMDIAREKILKEIEGL